MICQHCSAPKANPHGLCVNCGRFPTKDISVDRLYEKFREYLWNKQMQFTYNGPANLVPVYREAYNSFILFTESDPCWARK